MSAGQPHPSPAQPHMQTGGPSSYGAGYPPQMQQPRPQMMGGAGMPPRGAPMVYTPARPTVSGHWHTLRVFSAFPHHCTLMKECTLCVHTLPNAI